MCNLIKRLVNGDDNNDRLLNCLLSIVCLAVDVCSDAAVRDWLLRLQEMHSVTSPSSQHYAHPPIAPTTDVMSQTHVFLLIDLIYTVNHKKVAAHL